MINISAGRGLELPGSVKWHLGLGAGMRVDEEYPATEENNCR
jgi:hypothetical protein